MQMNEKRDLKKKNLIKRENNKNKGQVKQDKKRKKQKKKN